MVQCARETAGQRKVYMIGENESQDATMAMAPEEGGYGLDALWNDDFHHSAMVAMTGKREAYYTDYIGSSQEFISLLKYGFLYQGQYYSWQKKCRGVPAFALQPSAFILFIENHDQIANSRSGDRTMYLTDPGIFRAITALMLLAPGTPMIFQGQEFAASSPFLYFVDLRHDLEELVRRGRLEFLAQFPSLAGTDSAFMPDTGVGSFTRSKLDLNERLGHSHVYGLYKDLLKLRKDDPVFSLQRQRGMDGAVLPGNAFVLRYFGIEGDDRLVMVNLGTDLRLDSMPEPLLAPPIWGKWELMWSSEDYRYGGQGTRTVDTSKEFVIPSKCTLAFHPVNTNDIVGPA
jgi:maltooligosyltrehalose trehalohydrolase